MNTNDSLQIIHTNFLLLTSTAWSAKATTDLMDWMPIYVLRPDAEGKSDDPCR